VSGGANGSMARACARGWPGYPHGHSARFRARCRPDVSVTRHSRMTTDRLCDSRARGLVRLRGDGRENRTGRSREHTGKTVSGVRDSHERLLPENGENSRAKVQNVRGVVMIGAHPVA